MPTILDNSLENTYSDVDLDEMARTPCAHRYRKVMNLSSSGGEVFCCIFCGHERQIMRPARSGYRKNIKADDPNDI